MTSISFRSDGLGAGEDGRDDGVMATASHESGDIVFWDLNKGGRKVATLRGAHGPPPSASGGVGGGISKIEFLAGQAVIVSSGLDNTLKSWIFDETPFSPVPRILRMRMAPMTLASGCLVEAKTEVSGVGVCDVMGRAQSSVKVLSRRRLRKWACCTEALTARNIMSNWKISRLRQSPAWHVHSTVTVVWALCQESPASGTIRPRSRVTPRRQPR